MEGRMAFSVTATEVGAKARLRLLWLREGSNRKSHRANKPRPSWYSHCRPGW